MYANHLLPGDDEATCTWEDEELEPGVKKKRKKKIRSSGRLPFRPLDGDGTPER